MTQFAYSGEPTVAQVILRKLAKRLEVKQDRRLIGTRERAGFHTTIRLVLTLAGFTCLTIAGFQWTMIAGFVVAGMSCFALAWLNTPSTPVNSPDSRGRNG